MQPKNRKEGKFVILSYRLLGFEATFIAVHANKENGVMIDDSDGSQNC